MARVDTSIGSATIRHCMCELLLPPGLTRCSKCESHRKSLFVMLKRHTSSSATAAHPSSHTNYRYMTSPLLRERCGNLHKNCVATQRTVEHLKREIERLSTEHGLVVSEDLNTDLKAIMTENFSAISKQFEDNTFQQMFWKQHAQTSSRKDARGFRWHPAMIKWCLYLRHLSGKAYETLRSSGVLTLPSQRTLRDYTHYIPATSGFSTKVDEMLIDSVKVVYARIK